MELYGRIQESILKRIAKHAVQRAKRQMMKRAKYLKPKLTRLTHRHTIMRNLENRSLGTRIYALQTAIPWCPNCRLSLDKCTCISFDDALS